MGKQMEDEASDLIKSSAGERVKLVNHIGYPDRIQIGMMEAVLRLPYVPRWSIVSVSRVQSVAEHCYLVGWIASYLHAGVETGMPAGHLPCDPESIAPYLGWGMLHDAPESVTADIPSPAKQHGLKPALYELEEKTCPWYRDWRDAHIKAGGPRVTELVALADLVESHAYLSRWGVGERAQGVAHALGEVVASIQTGLDEATKVRLTRVRRCLELV